MIVTATGTGQLMAAITDQVSDEFLERADEVRALVTAMLAGQHSLLLGAPGTAKSDLARAITRRVDGAVYWEILLGEFTDPKQIFGPIDIAALMRGEYTQVFAGRATTAHIALIDEIFKCSVGALNSMLPFLNERIYHPENGGPPIHCPLIGAITASNELPSGASLAAIYDRLLIRLQVEYLQDPSNFAALLRSGVVRGVPPATRTTVSLDALLSAVNDEVPAVSVPDGVLDALTQLRTALRRRELISSDRRWKQAVRVLQAAAFLDGRAEVNDNDMDILRHMLWDSTADRRPVAEEVLSLVNPDARAALDLLETILQLEHDLEGLDGQSKEHVSHWGIHEATPKLGKAEKELVRMRAQAQSAGRSTDTIDQVDAKRRAVHARVMTEALGIPATMVNAGQP